MKKVIMLIAALALGSLLCACSTTCRTDSPPSYSTDKPVHAK